jgi:uncharacterized membrane protein
MIAWPPARLAFLAVGCCSLDAAADGADAGATKSRRVRRRAVAHSARPARAHTGRTGILIYLSLMERRAEIVADGRSTTRSTALVGEAMAADRRGARRPHRARHVAGG